MGSLLLSHQNNSIKAFSSFLLFERSASQAYISRVSFPRNFRIKKNTRGAIVLAEACPHFTAEIVVATLEIS